MPAWPGERLRRAARGCALPARARLAGPRGRLYPAGAMRCHAAPCVRQAPAHRLPRGRHACPMPRSGRALPGPDHPRGPPGPARPLRCVRAPAAQRGGPRACGGAARSSPPAPRTAFLPARVHLAPAAQATSRSGRRGSWATCAPWPTTRETWAPTCPCCCPRSRCVRCFAVGVSAWVLWTTPRLPAGRPGGPAARGALAIINGMLCRPALSSPPCRPPWRTRCPGCPAASHLSAHSTPTPTPSVSAACRPPWWTRCPRCAPPRPRPWARWSRVSAAALFLHVVFLHCFLHCVPAHGLAGQG